MIAFMKKELVGINEKTKSIDYFQLFLTWQLGCMFFDFEVAIGWLKRGKNSEIAQELFEGYIKYSDKSPHVRSLLTPLFVSLPTLFQIFFFSGKRVSL